jgi:hypothetical protein
MRQPWKRREKTISTLKRMLGGDLQDAVIQHQFDGLFRRWNSDNETERKGLHASGVVELDSRFCHRKHVLSFFYKATGDPLPAKTLRIFAAGWSIHEKWQTLFVGAGIASTVEAVRYSKEWDVYLTPDAVISLNGRRYIVEIKSMNTYEFGKLNKPPLNAVRQVNFYMHQLAIPDGIVLVEDKNTQEFRVWTVRYDPALVRHFVERMAAVHQNVERHGLAIEVNREDLPTIPDGWTEAKTPCKWCRYLEICRQPEVRKANLKPKEKRVFRDN